MWLDERGLFQRLSNVIMVKIHTGDKFEKNIDVCFSPRGRWGI